jgi:hypothetical protein
MPDNDLCETSQPTQQSVLNRSGKDKFVLLLNLPTYLKQLSKTNKDITLTPLEISVFGSVVPPIQVPSTEIRYAGQSYNVSSHSRSNYPPLPVNFIVDNEFHNYWILWKWLSILNDPDLSHYAGTETRRETQQHLLEQGNLKEYQTNLILLGLNEYNQPSIEFTFYNAFITTLGGINYDYNDSELIKSSAEFQFSKLKVELL